MQKICSLAWRCWYFNRQLVSSRTRSNDRRGGAYRSEFADRADGAGFAGCTYEPDLAGSSDRAGVADRPDCPRFAHRTDRADFANGPDCAHRAGQLYR
jgi:hypothetical protein